MNSMLELPSAALACLTCLLVLLQYDNYLP
jgi:hypothetical protein